MKNTIINNLINKGYSIWEKGNMKRIYINLTDLGYTESMANSREGKKIKVFYDINKGEFGWNDMPFHREKELKAMLPAFEAEMSTEQTEETTNEDTTVEVTTSNTTKNTTKTATTYDGYCHKCKSYCFGDCTA